MVSQDGLVLVEVAPDPGQERDGEADAEPEPDPRRDLGSAQRRGEVLLARGPEARASGALRQHDEPAAVVLVDARDAQPGRVGDLGDRLAARAPSTGTGPSDGRRTRAEMVWVRIAVPGGATSATTQPPGRAPRRPGAAARPGPPRCRCCRRPAARTPSGPRRAGGRTRRGAGRSRRGPGSGRRPPGRCRCPARPMPSPTRCSLIRPGPQPMSRVGPVQCASTAASPASARAAHRVIGSRCGSSS